MPAPSPHSDRPPPSSHSDLDPAKSGAFAARMLTARNDGALCLMVSIGHRTRLFDVMSTLPPSTSGEIAAAAGLNERYVREWLGAMVTARVVEVNPAGSRFVLLREHAAHLNRAAGADNIAGCTQYIAMLGAVEDAVAECFERGGGVPYDKFPRLQEVMAEDSGASVLSALESRILPLVPVLAQRLETGIRVLDVGCGRGRVLCRLAELYPRSQFAGMDLSPEAIAHARNAASAQGLRNIEFIAADLSDFDATARPPPSISSRPSTPSTTRRDRSESSRASIGRSTPMVSI